MFGPGQGQQHSATEEEELEDSNYRLMLLLDNDDMEEGNILEVISRTKGRECGDRSFRNRRMIGSKRER